MRLFEKLRQLRKRFSSYQPLVTVVIFKDRLLHNLHEFQKAAPHLKIAPVLKSNAYGHGLVNVAQIFDKENIAFFVVDSPFEAQQLRQAGIRAKILVIGYTTARNIKHSRLKNVSFTMTSLDLLKEVDKIITKPTTIHLKIDTGMHRQGMLVDEIITALQIVKNNPLILLEGVCSHLADPVGHEEQSHQQINCWLKALSFIDVEFPNLRYRHLASTGGALRTEDVHTNVARVGIGLYGFNIAQNSALHLKLALEMHAPITSIKKIQAGESVGYDYAFTAKTSMKIATLPVGYYEGINRHLSDQGMVLLQGHPCPIVGRVSMNITTVDVTALPQAALNDSALVISSDPTAQNSIDNMAKASHTIPYEILVHLPPHLRRVVQ